MSGKMEKTSVSSTSTQFVRKRMPKTPMMQPKPERSMTASGQGEVLSRSSISPLAEVYRTEEFRNAWANEVRFHVARNLLHLRRYRQMSQSTVGQAMGTSQSAVARIESGQENITLDTLQKMIGALNGRFYVSIRPGELQSRYDQPWWNSISSWTFSPADWNLIAVDSRKGGGDEVLGMLFRRSEVQRGETTPPAAGQLPEARVS